MDISVVVVTLNGRDALAGCLDALAGAAPDAERIVVNGPSADGTTGMVRGRDDVDVLIETADRNVNVARNVGVEEAVADAVAFVDERTAVSPGWAEAVRAALGGAPVVTGPVGRDGARPVGPERERFGRREVAFFDGANVAFRRSALAAIDGFDEYLEVGGGRDAAHRLAGLGLEVVWAGDVEASREAVEPPPMDDETGGRPLRALGYRLVKNYGPRPHVLGRMGRATAGELRTGLGAVLAGESAASRWLGDGARTSSAGCRGAVDGFRARLGDRRPARNPHGISSRRDRVVERYDL